MTNKLLFRIFASETLMNELENCDPYKANCISYYTEQIFEEFPDEQLSSINIDDSRREVFNGSDHTTKACAM